MAKLKAPLFSFGASGQLGKSLVYMVWKGINDVRQYVTPANPKSPLQIVQRDFLDAANAQWHASTFTSMDLAAFNLWAAQEAKTMSGFNRYVKGFLKARVVAEYFSGIDSLGVTNVTTTGFDVSAKSSAALTFTLYYGTSPTTMLLTAVVGNAGGTLTAAVAGLVKSTDYYFFIDCTTAGDQGRTGIVKQRTAAA